jgi:hypothetical protein
LKNLRKLAATSKKGEPLKICSIHLYLLIIVSIIISGCSIKLPLLNHDDNQNSTNTISVFSNSIKTIAVLPVGTKNIDGITCQLLRSRLLDELYFKGYSKLPLDIIDKKLASISSDESKESAATIAPQALKDLIGADAGLYCTLMEDNKSKKLFYAPIKIAIRCELHSAQTGEVIWNSQSESTSRNFDFTNKGLERKSSEVFETVIEEVVNKVMKTLPDGPNLRG